MALLLKRFLLVFLLPLVLVSVIQARFHFSNETDLSGAFTGAPHPELTWEDLRASTHQPVLEQYLKD
ncbi:MAG: hypothetical protein H7Z21_15080 [Hymenobacter sp.]|nr:hypothetical protein [Hymenobacter sp.]